MNERIAALIDKMNYSGLIYQAGDYEMSVTGKDLEYFAELIIKEAGEAFWSNACHVSDLAYEEYRQNSKKIKQHFEMPI